MADNHTKKSRSYNMSQIRSRGTKPEETVRHYLFSKGFRYRKNDKRYLGVPDIVLPKYKTIIFVNGCFWHKHDGCAQFIWPKSNRDYWEPKIIHNQERDRLTQAKLQENGWNVIVVWECEIKNNKLASERLRFLCQQIYTMKTYV